VVASLFVVIHSPHVITTEYVGGTACLVVDHVIDVTIVTE
jgi:hypothetical protein